MYERMKAKRATLLLGGLRSGPVTREQMSACPKSARPVLPWSYVYSLGPQEFALEHTLIEPFAGFIKTGISLEEIVKPIKNAVSGKLPDQLVMSYCYPRILL